MEIKESDGRLLNSYIRIYDNPIPLKFLNSFFQICKEHKFDQDGTLATGNQSSGALDKEIRNTKIWPLTNINTQSRTTVHWCNLFCNMFEEKFNNYLNDVTQKDNDLKIQSIDVLKYSIGGHYKFHTDHGPNTPRTLSAIYFVNDNYKGGELCFRTPKGEYFLEIEKISNRLIVWPSNFLFPHMVKPVTEGERYSIVSWAL